MTITQLRTSSAIPREKGRYLTQPMTKAPTPTGNQKKQRGNTKTSPKTSITQRLRTDLGQPVGVTTATQLVWLPPPPHSLNYCYLHMWSSHSPSKHVVNSDYFPYPSSYKDKRDNIYCRTGYDKATYNQSL